MTIIYSMTRICARRRILISDMLSLKMGIGVVSIVIGARIGISRLVHRSTGNTVKS